ncbi:TetR/AcrR family transcriptional regulator [Paenibacillus shenyangensis]|uniref:TetR/AcrR family transcriptional regulator n=1 Tax=Paenibacillus sp. A9 TaxID=1284352 RepID=UPI000365B24B|nr:TetR/AcrR family transcriptional regulator [Paenibacillus sp. A9]
MPKVDRRIIKSQEAIKKAFIELMIDKKIDQITIQEISDKANVSRRTVYLHYTDKFDLLDQLIEEHICELRKLCESEDNNGYIDTVLLWFEYFESHYLFFSTMLANQGGPFFRSRFLEFVLHELKSVESLTEGSSSGLNDGEDEDVIIQFFGSAIVGVVESWFKKEQPSSPPYMAQRVGALLEKNL